jgi:hypothetical protein
MSAMNSRWNLIVGSLLLFVINITADRLEAQSVLLDLNQASADPVGA